MARHVQVSLVELPALICATEYPDNATLPSSTDLQDSIPSPAMSPEHPTASLQWIQRLLLVPVAWAAATTVGNAAPLPPTELAWADIASILVGMYAIRYWGLVAQRRVAARNRPPGNDRARERARRESRLPPTLDQQRALAAVGPVRGVWTRASAARYLARHAAEQAATEARAWAAQWSECGVHMEQPEYMPAADRAAFDAACRACAELGLDFPVAPVLDPAELPAETARLRLAAGFFDHLESVQRRLLKDGTLRHPLGRPTLRRVFPEYALLLQVHAPAVQDATVELALLHRAKPTVLADESRGFELASFLRDLLAAAQSDVDDDEEVDGEPEAGAG
jgi:hypothetical protein